MVELSLFLASGLFAIGLGHCLYTFRVFEFGQPAIWFFGAGLAMMLLAALNLLSIHYSQTALPGLKTQPQLPTSACWYGLQRQCWLFEEVLSAILK